jgi:hypothetical protein
VIEQSHTSFQSIAAAVAEGKKRLGQIGDVDRSQAAPRQWTATRRSQAAAPSKR